MCECVCVCECVCSKLTFPVEPPSVHRMVDVSWPGTVFVAPGKIYVAVALYLCVCACVRARECVSVCVCVCALPVPGQPARVRLDRAVFFGPGTSQTRGR